MFYEVVKLDPLHGRMTIFVEADTPAEARLKTRGNIVGIRPRGPRLVPDLSAKLAYGYSAEEWREVRRKRTHGRRPNPRGPRRAK